MNELDLKEFGGPSSVHTFYLVIMNLDFYLVIMT